MLNVLQVPSVELMLSQVPTYYIDEEGWYVIDFFRGSNNDNLEGVSWWTTCYATALVYANMHKGFIIHRCFRIYAEHGFLYNPHQYLLGGRPSNPKLVMEPPRNYMYGFNMEIKTDDMTWHFDMSITENMLNAMSYEVARYERTQLPHVPGKNIKFTF
jgi:hypothetical protein